MMIFNNLLAGTRHKGFFAGTGDGIATLDNTPISRDIVVLDAKSLAVIWLGYSLASGHYMVQGLDADTEYMIMIRDHQKQKECFAYDYIKPATTLTPTEQKELWLSWQVV